MKTIVYDSKKLTLLSVLFTFSFFAYSQETIKESLDVDNKGRPVYWNHIKVNVAGLVFGHWGLAYERKIDKKVSLQLAFDVADFTNHYKKSNTQRYDYNIKGFGIEPEIRYYYGRNAMRGFYIGGYLTYRKYDANVSVYKIEDFNIVYPDNTSQLLTFDYSGPGTIRLRHFGVGILTGAQFIISTRVSIGFNVGVSVGKLSINQPVTFQIHGSAPNPSGVEHTNGVFYKKGDSETLSGTATASTSQTFITGIKMFDKQDIPLLPRFGITIGYLFGY